jgi:hypothetical protein
MGCDGVDISARHQGDRVDEPGNIFVRVSADERTFDEFQPLDMLGEERLFLAPLAAPSSHGLQ